MGAGAGAGLDCASNAYSIRQYQIEKNSGGLFDMGNSWNWYSSPGKKRFGRIAGTARNVLQT